MKIQQFFEKAIQGGWKLLHNPSIQEDISELVVYLDPKLPIIRKMRRYEILLDPLAWKAVGKTMKWNGDYCDGCGTAPPMYRYYMHRFIDHLCDGLTLEEALDRATS